MKFNEIAKKFAPEPLKNLVRWFRRVIEPVQKRLLVKKMRVKHQQLLENLKGKEKVKVVFLMIHSSTWKVDTVFKKMLSDPDFEPIILVCPYTVFGEERMWKEMQITYEYFKQKGYPVLSSFNQIEQRWITLDEIKTDLVFFTNPHKITHQEYYKDAYTHYLSCYVPYHYEVGLYDNNQSQYNQIFHNSIWKIFAPHKTSMNIFKSTCATHGWNVELTGYPYSEILIPLRYSICDNKVPYTWKQETGNRKQETGNRKQETGNRKQETGNRKRILWSPHHTIDSPELPYSNFLKYAEFFKEIAIAYQDKVQWCFKPHPILKSKLEKHPDWGVDKTKEYYNFWRNSEFTQLNEGEYVDLFLQSSAMIHDCGSFLAEYLHVNKPVLYLIDSENYLNFYNDFGKKALDCCELGRCENDIFAFVDRLIDNDEEDVVNINEEKIKKLLQEECPREPSTKIINILKMDLSNGC